MADAGRDEVQLLALQRPLQIINEHIEPGFAALRAQQAPAELFDGVTVRAATGGRRYPNVVHGR